MPPLHLFSFLIFLGALLFAVAITAYKPRYGLAAMIVADPFDYSHKLSLTTISIPKVFLIGVLIGLLVRRTSLRPLWNSPVRPLFLAASAIFIVTALTGIPGLYIDAVARETLKSLEYVATFSIAALAFVADPDDRTAWFALSATVVVVCALSLVQEVSGAPSAVYVGGAVVRRIAGPLEGPNQLAGYLAIAIPMLLARVTLRRDWFATVVVAVAAITDVLTLSRAGAFGITFGIIAVVARVAQKRVRFAIVGGFAILLVLGALVLRHLGALARLSSIGDVNFNNGLGTRSELWGAAWQFFLAHPILGIGAGNFELQLPTLGIVGVRTHANSLYLQALSEGGILLFIATVAAIVIAIRLLYVRSDRNALAIGAGSATIALAMHQLFDTMTFFPKVGGFWWMCLGIGAASMLVRARTIAEPA